MGQVRENFDSQKSQISSLIFFTFTFFYFKKTMIWRQLECVVGILWEILRCLESSHLFHQLPVSRLQPSASHLQISTNICRLLQKEGKLEILPFCTWLTFCWQLRTFNRKETEVNSKHFKYWGPWPQSHWSYPILLESERLDWTLSQIIATQYHCNDGLGRGVRKCFF